MKTVLLIEDNEFIRENITEMLELAHYQVLSAENGKKGLELALQRKPDIVLCDVMMPVMDGYGVLLHFKEKRELAAIPFIFLSAATERTDVRKGMASGVDGYITKPFGEDDLMQTVEIHLQRADALKNECRQSFEGIQELISTARQYKELEYLTQDKKVYAYKKKQILYLAGTEPTRLFFVRRGKVKTYRSNQDGKEYITGIYREGDFFGYLPLIEETECQEAAETMEDSEVVVIPKSEFMALLYQDPHIAKRLIKMLASSVSEKEKLLSGMAYNSLRKRAADSLLFLHSKYQTHHEPRPFIQISRDDIAGIVGSSTESLIRTLSDFKKEQLIDIVDGKILIKDEQKLQHMPN
ncbi:response regulator [Pontibacter saemangeumensis]|uniref:Response regulator n=1 Tax=Pontibacter saemangeumensis TaxID=1084525 RepID=A0ABP8LW04_9BACT